jgi:hypothetical protein
MAFRVVKVLALASTLGLVVPGALEAQRAAGGGGRGGGGGPGLTLTSTAWEDGGVIPAKHAGGMGVSPALSWTNAPQGTVEFVLVMNDPEPVRPALSVSGDILHWMVVKIPATTTSLPEGAGAAQSTTLPAGARQVQPYRGPGAPAAGCAPGPRPEPSPCLGLVAQVTASLRCPPTATRSAPTSSLISQTRPLAITRGTRCASARSW